MLIIIQVPSNDINNIILNCITPARRRIIYNDAASCCKKTRGFKGSNIQKKLRNRAKKVFGCDVFLLFIIIVPFPLQGERRKCGLLQTVFISVKSCATLSASRREAGTQSYLWRDAR